MPEYDIPSERGYDWKRVSDRIKKERGRVCEVCGDHNGKYEHCPVMLYTHHIVKGRRLPVGDARIDDNLAVVCPRCHGKMEGRSAKRQFAMLGRGRMVKIISMLEDGRCTPQYISEVHGLNLFQIYHDLHQLSRMRVVRTLTGSLYELADSRVATLEAELQECRESLRRATSADGARLDDQSIGRLENALSTAHNALQGTRPSVDQARAEIEAAQEVLQDDAD